MRFRIRRGRKRKRPKPNSRAWLEQIEELKMVTYVYRNGKLVDKRKARPLHYINDAPGVISDIMDPTLHHANGKTYESKKEFRAATKAAGCIEYGNDAQALPRPRKPIQMDRGQRRDQIRQALYEARNK